MRAKSILIAAAFGMAASAALAQSGPGVPPSDPGVVADEDLTLVVGTRFVSASDGQASPPTLFREARIPLASFNETDRCIDAAALELANDYFNSLGRALGKAGYFYLVPEEEIVSAAASCQKLHGIPPQAWISKRTSIIAFGKVVATKDAPALEEELR